MLESGLGTNETVTEAQDRKVMERTAPIDEDAAWRAVTARDRAADGRFVTGVLTTGIYCRPSCPARHPRRENVRFYAVADDAERDGLRACLRCKPNEISRETAAVEKAIALLSASEQPPALEEIAAAVGYSPFH